MSNYEYVADCYDPFDLELKHWKYIDKYKRNGNWVYIYKDGSATGDPRGVRQVGSSMMTLTNRGKTQYGIAGKGVSSSSYKVRPSDKKYSHSSTVTHRPGVTGNPQVSKTYYMSSREKKARKAIARGKKYVAKFLNNLADRIND